jgi:transposase
MGGEQQQQRNPRRFTEEVKRDAVNLVRSTGRPIAAVARELGIYDSTLGTGCPRTASTVARPRG